MSLAPSTEIIDLIKMSLHETRIVEHDNNSFLFTTIMRVPNGLIYRSFDKGNGIMGAVFVPFGDRFEGV